jgi:hypothetical protein
VFVREQLHLQVPVAVVRERLLTQLQADGLYTASSEALNRGPSTIDGDGNKGDGHSSGDGQVRADGQAGGDGKVAFESRHLTVHTLTPYARGPVTVLPIRWFTDEAGDGQPSLDANLEFGPSETDATTQLLLAGVFRPVPPTARSITACYSEFPAIPPDASSPRSQPWWYAAHHERDTRARR